MHLSRACVNHKKGCPFAPDCIVGPFNDNCCLYEVLNVDLIYPLGVHWNVDNLLCVLGKGYGFIYEVDWGDWVLTWHMV